MSWKINSNNLKKRERNAHAGSFAGSIEDKKKRKVWTKAIEEVEKAYLKLIKIGVTPQEARCVLPNSLKQK